MSRRKRTSKIPGEEKKTRLTSRHGVSTFHGTPFRKFHTDGRIFFFFLGGGGCFLMGAKGPPC